MVLDLFFNKNGKLERYGVTFPISLVVTLNRLYDYGWKMEEIVPLASSNTAKIYKFDLKGHVDVGFDADLLVIDKNFVIEHVIGGGEWLKKFDWVKTSMFE